VINRPAGLPPSSVAGVMCDEAHTSTTETAARASKVCLSQFLFTGRERDSESGIDHFGVRYYARSIGRFLSPDCTAKEFGD
jgi:RHS repeat-associated protein